MDNTHAHNALSVKHYLAAKGIPLLKHMPYSPDLASCHFFLFPKIKSAFKRNPVRVDGRGEVKIGGAPKCSYKRRLAALLWTVEKTNGTVCGEGRGVHWRRAFNCRIIFKIKLFHKYEGGLISFWLSLPETLDKRLLGRESDKSWCHCYTMSMIKLSWSQPKAPWASAAAYWQGEKFSA